MKKVIVFFIIFTTSLFSATPTWAASDNDTYVEFTINNDNYKSFVVGGRFEWYTEESDKSKSFHVGSWAGGFNWDDKYVVIKFKGCPDKLNFKYRAGNGTATGVKFFVKESEDGKSWSQEIWSSKRSDLTFAQVSNVQLQSSTRYIMLCYSGNFGAYFQNINVTKLENFEVSASVLDFGTTIKYYECAPQTISLEYANIGRNVTLSTDDSRFVVSPMNFSLDKGSCGEYGPITVTYLTDKQHDNDNAVLTVKDDEGRVLYVTLKGHTQNGEWRFDREDGNWIENPKWTYNGENTTHVPDPTDRVFIDKSVTISGHISIYKMEIEDEGSVIISPTGGLTVGTGGIIGATANNLILMAGTDGDLTGVTGYLRIDPACTEAMPSATVEMYSKSYADPQADAKDVIWQFTGTPVTKESALSALDVYGADAVVKSWSTAYQTWGTLKSTASLAPFSAYACTQSTSASGATFSHKGQLVKDSKQRTMSNTSSEDIYYIFANSYAAPIDLTSINMNETFQGNIDKTIYVYNTGTYRQAEDGAGSGDAPGQYTAIPVGNAAEIARMKGTKSVLIPSMQGFVLTCQPGQSGSFNFDYQSMVWNADYSSLGSTGVALKAIARGEQEVENVEDLTSIRLAMSLHNGGCYSELFMLERPNFSSEYDNGFDARLMDEEAELALFANINGDNYSFLSSDSVVGSYLGFNAGKDSIYTLRFAYSESTEPLYLIDLANDSVVVIEAGNCYTFAQSDACNNSLRFRIATENLLPESYWENNLPSVTPDVTTSITSADEACNIWQKDDNLFMTSDGPSMFVLFDMNGRLVEQASYCYTHKCSLSGLPSGVYVARTGNRLLKIVR